MSDNNFIQTADVAEICDNLFQTLLEEKNLTFNDVARFSFEQAQKFEKDFIIVLKENNIDLSFKKGPYSSIAGKYLSGNRSAITNDYVRGIIYSRWAPVIMDKDAVKKYFIQHPDCKVFVEDNCGFSKEISQNQIFNYTLGTEVKTTGYGSGSNTTITKTSLAWILDGYDLRVQRSFEKWD